MGQPVPRLAGRELRRHSFACRPLTIDYTAAGIMLIPALLEKAEEMRQPVANKPAFPNPLAAYLPNFNLYVFFQI